MTLKTVKCPYSDCGYVCRIDVEEVAKGGKTPLVRKFGQGGASRPDREEYTDLVCPKCNRVFEWKIT